jgi:hypothetical protein
MNPETLDSFVDADEAAKFLSLTRRRVLDLARARKLPGHPIGDGARRVWRFRLSELSAASHLTAKIWVCFSGASRYGSAPNNFRLRGELGISDGSKGLVNKTQNQTQRNDLGLSLLSRQARNREESREYSHYRIGVAFPTREGCLGERRYLKPDSAQDRIGRVTFRELVENYRKESFNRLGITTQPITAHIPDHYLLPRWGDSFALDIEPDSIEEWLGALVLANPTKEKIRRAMNVVYRRGQKSRILPMTGDGTPVAFVTQSSKSNYKAIIVSPEQAFRIMVELKDPYRMLVFLVAVTGLRISEALGLKWSDLDYERQMIHLRRVWVGNDVIEHLKTDGSAAPVPLGELLADALRGWHSADDLREIRGLDFPIHKTERHNAAECQHDDRSQDSPRSG